MLAETSLIAAHLKIVAACAVILATFIADGFTKPASYEDVGLKTILIIAIVYLARLLTKQQEEHKTERAKDAEKHLADAAVREEKMLAAVNRQSDAMERVAQLTEEQTSYFKTVTRTIVDERLAKKPNVP